MLGRQSCDQVARCALAMSLSIWLPLALCWGGLAGPASRLPDRIRAEEGHHLPKLSRHLRYVLFPQASTMGLFLAIAIPLDLPNKDVSLSWNFEANYALPPYNTSQFVPSVLVRGASQGRDEGQGQEQGQEQGQDQEHQQDQGQGRGRRDSGATLMDRTRFYELVESHLESEGLPGRACLLRSICEAAETPLRHNGLVGDLLHVLLTPSSSEDEGLPAAFAQAEARGAAGEDCALAHGAACPLSVLGLVSELL